MNRIYRWYKTCLDLFMLKRYLTIFGFLLASLSFGQYPFLEGTWQGIIQREGTTVQKPVAFWVKFEINPETKEITGTSRCETPFTDYYALKLIKGKSDSRNVLSFEETMLGNQKNSGSKFWCLFRSNLNYNDSTGYLEGRYTSSDCRSNSGRIILYRSKYSMSESDTVTKYHSWVTNFENDLKRGWNAYYIREKAMRDFEIKPVYFAHDKDNITADFESYLKQMVGVVSSHTDLRIKIIGHTDSNGPDSYNVDLSERRANNVKKMLIDLGIPEDRVVIEFRGERDPAVSNVTFKGKQLNRRVDFEFV